MNMPKCDPTTTFGQTAAASRTAPSAPGLSKSGINRHQHQVNFRPVQGSHDLGNANGSVSGVIQRNAVILHQHADGIGRQLTVIGIDSPQCNAENLARFAGCDDNDPVIRNAVFAVQRQTIRRTNEHGCTRRRLTYQVGIEMIRMAVGRNQQVWPDSSAMVRGAGIIRLKPNIASQQSPR